MKVIGTPVDVDLIILSLFFAMKPNQRDISTFKCIFCSFLFTLYGYGFIHHFIECLSNITLKLDENKCIDWIFLSNVLLKP